MNGIFLLDCTLRDGGYINDWHFGEIAIRNICRKIVLSGVEYFEAGFLRDAPYDPEYSLFDGNKNAESVFFPKKTSVKYVGMIDMNAPIPIEKLGPRTEGGFDVLRVIFKKPKADDAYLYISQLSELGYEVFAQPVGTDGYTAEEFYELICRFNSLPITAFYIVDSFGVIKKKKFLKYLTIADSALRDEVMLGYHSHNNMQQAMGNACAMAEYGMTRDIVIDACIYGMGRGAGNLNMELFAEYMNENFGRHYRIEPMLEIIDEYLNDIYRKHFWGYSLPYYLTASNGCHPNYATFYSAKGTLTFKSCDELLKSIPLQERANFDEKKAEERYRSYLEYYVDDTKECSDLAAEFSGRDVLLVGPGKTLQTECKGISRYIDENRPIVISLNFLPQDIDVDYAFSCHMRRYKHIQYDDRVKKIITSNLREAEVWDRKINFSSYKVDNDEIMENSGLVCLNFLIHIGVRHVAIAGMDGYDISHNGNYVSSGLEYDADSATLQRRNELIRGEINRLGSLISIDFLTKSIYSQA